MSSSNPRIYILDLTFSVFSVLENTATNKTVTLTSDTLFDLLMLKLTNVYKKKTTIESKGPRFEIGDFIVKLGSVTVGGVFKGILVEVEYCPCVVPNNCWGILQEFMQVGGSCSFWLLMSSHLHLHDIMMFQGFLGSCVSNNPPQHIASKGSDTYSAVDTIHQYLQHFNIFRKTAGVR